MPTDRKPLRYYSNSMSTGGAITSAIGRLLIGAILWIALGIYFGSNPFVGAGAALAAAAIVIFIWAIFPLIQIASRSEPMRRLLKWSGFIIVVFLLMLTSLFANAHLSGMWGDRFLRELAQNWDAEVIAKNVPASLTQATRDQGLQNALNNIKSIRLQGLTPTACTHGPNYTKEGGLAFKSHCITSAKFEDRVIQFEFELKGFGNQWQLTSFRFYPDPLNRR